MKSWKRVRTCNDSTGPFHSILEKAVLGLGLGIVALGFGVCAKAQESVILTFDAPGADTNPGDYNGTFPTAINSSGVIAGYYQDTNSAYHGFLRRPNGHFTIFQAPGAGNTPYAGTTPSTINDLGVITGNYVDTNGFVHGFVRSPDGKFKTFDVKGDSFIAPRDINAKGAIVGYYADSNGTVHAFLRSPEGKMTTWDGPGACETNSSQGCYGSGASAINAFGLTAGGYEDNSGNFVHHNFVRSPDGRLTLIDVPEAGTGSYQGTGCPGCDLGINRWGAVAGPYIDANNVQHGWLRSPTGTFTTYDVPDAGTGSYQGTGCPSDCPTSLNDRGAIMGTYIDASYTFHGYLRTPEGGFETIDPTGSIYTWSTGLNNSGMITGYYADANYVFHGFVRIRD